MRLSAAAFGIHEVYRKASAGSMDIGGKNSQCAVGLLRSNARYWRAALSLPLTSYRRMRCARH